MSDRLTPEPRDIAPSDGTLTPASMNGRAGNSAAELRWANGLGFLNDRGVLDGLLVIFGAFCLLIEEF